MTFKTVSGGSFDRIRDGCGQKDQQNGPSSKKLHPNGAVFVLSARPRIER